MTVVKNMHKSMSWLWRCHPFK